ncbi:MAG: peptidoglycan-binding protein [Pseudomonadota bacterium]
MYPLLRYGNKLPTVAAAQILINRKMRQGTYVGVDGIYGRNTREGVRSFQRERKLGPDGIIGKNTWAALIAHQRLQVIDSVDLSNHGDIGYEDKAIRNAGGKPLTHFGMSGGVRVVMRSILQRAQPGGVVLLRFHGHGAPGAMGLTTGIDDEATSEFGLRFLEDLVRDISGLRPIFAPFGSVELHGCRVGSGKDGRRLITALARAWRVPVTAGVRTQYGGGASTFRFEGRTVTAFPSGNGLKQWARSIPVPEVHGMSVAS